jgi:pyrroline-5-carboxylate reductase
VLRQKVTSKGGTTEAALASLAAAGWHDTMVAAVQAAAARGRELGAELGKD